jgi:putative ABC transport system permease protein
VRALDRKLLRDAARLVGPAVALSAILACGVAALVALRGTARSLERSRDSFYARMRFSDLVAGVVRAPQRVAREVAALPGVAHVEARLSTWAPVELEGVGDPIRLQVSSLPERQDLLALLEGTLPGRGELLLGEGFARAHGLRRGATLHVLLNGQRRAYAVAGVATAPDAVYVLAPASPWPDDRRAGVLWLAREELEGALDLEGAFNELRVTLAPGASLPEVSRQLEAMLHAYGGVGVRPRSEQLSPRFVDEELRQLDVQARFVPGVFLAVAAFLLRDVMARLLGTQRETVALLKALGYGRTALMRHYLLLAWGMLLPGALVGTAAGAVLVRGLLALYRQYFRFDRLVPDVSPAHVALAVGVAWAAALLGAWHAVSSATAIPPAEAMQPSPPPAYGRGLTRLPDRVAWLSPGTRMVLRTLLRRPLRTALSVLGLALAGALLALAGVAWDAMEQVIVRTFQEAAREDVSVTFYDARGREALDELAALPGVWRVEGQRSVPVRLQGPKDHWSGSVVARPADGRLRRVLDAAGREARPPPEGGLVLTDVLAVKLGVSVGDVVQVTREDGDRRVRDVSVVGLSHEPLALGALVAERTARSLFGGEQYTGALLRVDAAEEPALLGLLARMPRVTGVAVRRAGLAAFRRMMADSVRVTRTVLTFFASVLAAGVVYNDGRVALAEQARELATLRVLGFTRGEVARLFLGGLGARVLASLAPGWWLGWLFATWLMRAIGSSELFRLPLVASPRTWLFGTAVVAVASALTALLLATRVRRLDLVAVLKARE